MHKNKILIALVAAIVFGTVPAFAGEPIIWDLGSRAELLKGEAHGISIGDTGVVTLAPRTNELFNTEQAYVWSTAIDTAGNATNALSERQVSGVSAHCQWATTAVGRKNMVAASSSCTAPTVAITARIGVGTARSPGSERLIDRWIGCRHGRDLRVSRVRVMPVRPTARAERDRTARHVQRESRVNSLTPLWKEATDGRHHRRGAFH